MEVVIYGIGPFAKLLHYYLTNDSDYEVVAFCADEAYIKEKEFCGLPVVAFEDIENIYRFPESIRAPSKYDTPRRRAKKRLRHDRQ